MKPKLLLYLALVLSGLPAANCAAAIIYPKEPDGGRQMVIKFLNPLSLKFLSVSNLDDLTITAPCQSYYVGDSNLASGQLLSAVKSGTGGGWQYLLIRGTNAVGLAYLIANEKSGKALKCYEVDSGPAAAETLKALHIAEQLPQVRKQDYELRLLGMPWLEFRAVWLHGKSNDIFVPLPDAWGRWSGYQPRSESEMIKVLKPVAEKKLKEPGLD